MRRLLRRLKKIVGKEEPSSWKLVYDHFSPAQESLREALCTLGNGYFGTRGAVYESAASRKHYPGTYIAGVYNRLSTHLAGQTVKDESLVNCPNWLFLTFKIDKGKWITPTIDNLLSFRQQLDMHQGILSRKLCLKDSKGQKTVVQAQRIVHMAEPHRAAIRYVIIPENYEGWITVSSGLDGTVKNTGVARYSELNPNHLKSNSLGTFGHNGLYLSVKTSQSQIEIAEACKVNVFSAGQKIGPSSRIVTRQNKAIFQEFKIYVRKNHRYELEKIVSVYTSRDEGVRNPLDAAIQSVKNSKSFAELLKSHKRTWGVLWKRFDIQVEGDPFAQKVLRLHIFHLLQCGSIHNTRVDAGLPARGLHGEAYRGHIFWDSVFTMHFFDLHAPEISKAFLLYRYRRLNQAQKNASESWYRGAMFPWQSGSTGEEETPVTHLNPMSGKWGPDYSHFQRHISFAIAYNVWQYWRKTQDKDFLIHWGAQLLLSIARFGASLCQYDSGDGRFHTERIMGPDEFHEKYPWSTRPGLRDNAYTNLLIVWTLLRAQEAIKILPKHHRGIILKKLKLQPQELARWDYITRKMNIVINDEGIIGQFDGYFSLQELDWAGYRKKYGKIQRMDRILKAEGKSPNEFKVAKQADALMLFYLFPVDEIKYLFNRLGYNFSKDMLKKNYKYYIQRTSHGSTLSKVVHCYLAHLLGKHQEAWEWFVAVLKSDIYDTQGGTTPEGIHAGVMGASIDIVFRGFAGIDLRPERIKITPCLPKHWRSVKLRFRYMSRWISLSINKQHIAIMIIGPKEKCFKIPVEIEGKDYLLSFAKMYKILLKKQHIK